MDSQTYFDFLREGTHGSHLLKSYLEAKGFTVVSTGYEHPLPSELLRKLPELDLLKRSSPEEVGFIACHDKFPPAYWHAQAQTGQHPAYFTLEKTIYHKSRAWERAGIPAVAAFLAPTS